MNGNNDGESWRKSAGDDYRSAYRQAFGVKDGVERSSSRPGRAVATAEGVIPIEEYEAKNGKPKVRQLIRVKDESMNIPVHHISKTGESSERIEGGYRPI